jgi:hypothetical protein
MSDRIGAASMSALYTRHRFDASAGMIDPPTATGTERPTSAVQRSCPLSGLSYVTLPAWQAQSYLPPGPTSSQQSFRICEFTA